MWGKIGQENLQSTMHKVGDRLTAAARPARKQLLASAAHSFTHALTCMSSHCGQEDNAEKCKEEAGKKAKEKLKEGYKLGQTSHMDHRRPAAVPLTQLLSTCLSLLPICSLLLTAACLFAVCACLSFLFGCVQWRTRARRRRLN